MVLGQPSGSGPCIVAVTMIRRRQRRREMAMLCYEYVMFHKFWRLIPFGYTTLLKTSEWFVVLNPAIQSHPTHGVRERTNNIKSTMTRAPAKVAQVGTWWISMGGLAVLQFPWRHRVVWAAPSGTKESRVDLGAFSNAEAASDEEFPRKGKRNFSCKTPRIEFRIWRIFTWFLDWNYEELGKFLGVNSIFKSSEKKQNNKSCQSISKCINGSPLINW